MWRVTLVEDMAASQQSQSNPTSDQSSRSIITVMMMHYRYIKIIMMHCITVMMMHYITVMMMHCITVMIMHYD
jgi:hypothetical protein